MHRPNLDLILMPTMACNMACDYCYVLTKHVGVMDKALAKRAIEQIIARNDPSVPTNVYWHGAEPLLAGIEFYRDICSWARERYGQDAIRHHIQTNGTLLNDEWFDLFIEEHITTGVSLDGPQELHDAYRQTHAGHGTFERIFNNIMAARKKKLFFDALCVITRKTIGHEDELFDFFAEYKIDFGFEPLVPETEQMAQEFGITPQEYAQVAIRLFDRWFFQQERRLRMVAPPYHVLRSILMGGNTYCTFSQVCAWNYVAVSPDGTVHSCIMFARHPDLAFGNLVTSDLPTVLASPVRRQFLKTRVQEVEKCQRCRWVNICQAGCPHHAYVHTGTLFQPDAFCESYRLIFDHVYQVAMKTLPTEAASISLHPA